VVHRTALDDCFQQYIMFAKYSGKRSYLLSGIALLYALKSLSSMAQVYFEFQWMHAAGNTLAIYVGYFGWFIAKYILEDLFFVAVAFKKWKWVSFVLPFNLKPLFIEAKDTIESSWSQLAFLFQLGKFVAIMDLALVAMIAVNTLFLLVEVIIWLRGSTPPLEDQANYFSTVVAQPQWPYGMGFKAIGYRAVLLKVIGGFSLCMLVARVAQEWFRYQEASVPGALIQNSNFYFLFTLAVIVPLVSFIAASCLKSEKWAALIILLYLASFYRTPKHIFRLNWDSSPFIQAANYQYLIGLFLYFLIAVNTLILTKDYIQWQLSLKKLTPQPVKIKDEVL